jgi:SAM-dependent methyltransferase
MEPPAQSHYTHFLAGNYAWISGGFAAQSRKNGDFFVAHAILPGAGRTAIDLGAGCGFQSVPLARLGWSVLAVDFCQPLLEELRSRAGSMPVRTVPGDIQEYSTWSGRRPALIVCMGDTLTHLPSMDAVNDLLRQCSSELIPGGRLVLTCRDYTREPDGAVSVIPVSRDPDRIFLCRLEYHADTVTVQDILYFRSRGSWVRTAGTYGKIRIDPETLSTLLAEAGFFTEYESAAGGLITVIARKDQ